MGLFDGLRGLAWPSSMPRTIADAPKARATWPTLAQPSPSTGMAGPAAEGADFWSSAVWNIIHSEAELIDRSRSYGDFYKEQPWVYTVVNKLNRGIGRLPLKVYRIDGAGNRERVRDSALARLLDAPEPRVTRSLFRQRIVGDLALYGNALLLKVARRPGDAPASLQWVPPIGWSKLADGSYRYTSPRTGQPRDYEPWQLIHYKFWSPEESNGFACAPLEPLRRTVAILDAAQRLGVAAFKHGGNTPGILTTEAKYADVKAAADRIGKEWALKHGGVDNAYKTPVLTDGLKWMATGGSLADAAVVEHHRLGREEVCAVYDVPPPLVGLLDRATFSNITEQARWLVQHTFAPYGTLIEETLAAHLIDGVAAFAGEFVEFDYSEILKGDLPSRYTAYMQAITGGFKTQNEIRKLENDPPMVGDPDADRLHRPGNLTPMLTAPAAAPPAPALNGAKEHA